MKGVMRFGKKEKLIPRFIGPFEILDRVGEVVYRLALPLSLSVVHLVFHVSMLRKYHGYPSHALDFSTVQLDKDLTYEEEPIAALDRQVRQLRSKKFPSVCVPWRVEVSFMKLIVGKSLVIAVLVYTSPPNYRVPDPL
ncbi:uncharacterized protein [Nicotiana sylvestris]|uniref:uncharacterized protein n=1 Tax=Nicotiana sylvestris TaxID=4096 RepID=UPI00388C55F8